MLERPNASQVLSLEIDSLTIRGALVKFQKGPTLVQTFRIKIDQEHSTPSNVKPLYMDNQESDLHQWANKSLVVTALPTSEALVRSLEVQLTKESDIDAVLEFQTENLLPFPIESCIIDRMIIEKKKESTLLSVIAAKKDHIKQHLDLWHGIGIEPEVVSCMPAALASFSAAFSPSQKAHIVIHLGNSQTTCLVVEGGKLLSAQSYDNGLQTLREAYKIDLAERKVVVRDEIEQLDFSKLVSDEDFPELTKAATHWRLEIMKIAYAQLKQIRGKEVDEILVTGEGVSWKNLSTTLLQGLNKKILAPIANPAFPIGETDMQEFASCIGQALTALPGAKDQINFRQKEFLYPNPWKRFKKPIALFLGSSILLAAMIYTFGQLYIDSKENTLRREYANLLMKMHKPINEFEKGFQPKGAEEHPGEAQTPHLFSLSQQDIQRRLDVLEKEIKATPDMFPLLPNIPRVSDVLAWLNSLPHIKGEGAGEPPKIKLESFSYKIVKRPDQNKKKDKYQAKVELEFSASTPTYAREFHDILLAPNALIDPNTEVSWNAERGKYRASFFLKDKTIYPAGKS